MTINNDRFTNLVKRTVMFIWLILFGVRVIDTVVLPAVLRVLMKQSTIS